MSKSTGERRGDNFGLPESKLGCDLSEATFTYLLEQLKHLRNLKISTVHIQSKILCILRNSRFNFVYLMPVFRNDNPLRNRQSDFVALTNHFID